MSKQKGIYFLFVFLIGIIFYYFNAFKAPGVTHDSIYYFEGAEDIAKGNGFTLYQWGISSLCKHYPPFYSFLLALIKIVTNLDITTCAYILNGLTFSLTLVGLFFFFNLFASNIYLNLGVAFFCLLQSDILEQYFMALSEPLFLCLMIWGFYTLNIGLKNKNNFILFLTGLLLGFATLTRYIGYIFIPVLVLTILFSNHNIKDKIKSISISLMSYFAVVGIWIARNIIYADKIVQTSLVKDTNIPDGLFNMGFSTVTHWLINFSNSFINLTFPIFLYLLVFVFLFFIIYRLYIMKTLDENYVKLIPLLIFFLGYFPMLILSVKYIDKATPWDIRILSPANFVFIILLMSFLLQLDYEKIKNTTILKYASILFFIIIGGLFLNEMRQSKVTLFLARNEGKDLSDRDIENKKPIIKDIKNIKDSLLIISESYDDGYLRYTTGKNVRQYNDIYKLKSNDQVYIAYYNKRNALPKLDYGFKKIDTLRVGHLYKITLN